MSKIKQLEIVYKDISDLIFSDYNPRILTAKKKRELTESIKKFGLRSPININGFEGRENVIISGHQRVEICKSLGILEVPCIVDFLNIDDEKEANLRFNKNGGDFIAEKVQEMFELDKLLEIGFAQKFFKALDTEFQKKFQEIDTTEPTFPIVARFNEKYNFVMIVTDKDIDFTWLKNLLELETSQCYKSENVGLSKIITVKTFQKLYKKWTSK